jgi:hypothetical protein
MNYTLYPHSLQGTSILLGAVLHLIRELFTDLEDFNDVVQLAMDVSYDIDWRLQP